MKLTSITTAFLVLGSLWCAAAPSAGPTTRSTVTTIPPSSDWVITRAAPTPLLLQPAQLSSSGYGIFAYDPATQTILVYQWNAAARRLDLVAARCVADDRRLTAFNTHPPLAEISAVVSQFATTQPVETPRP